MPHETHETIDFVELAETRLRATLMPALFERQAHGALREVEGLEGYNFFFISSWNTLVTSGPDALSDTQFRMVESTLVNVFALSLFYDTHTMENDIADGSLTEPQAVEWVEEAVTALLSTGTTHHGATRQIFSPVVDNIFQLSMDNWTPQIMQRNPAHSISDRSAALHIPLPPISVPPVVTGAVSFPSGRLVIADWIRIEAFTEAVASDEFEINAAQERIARTAHVLRTHNLIEVTCSGHPALVVEHHNGEVSQLRIGRIETDEEDRILNPDLDQVGKISTRYRAVAIIDKADLMTILGDAGLPDPETTFADWRSDITSRSDAIEIDVPAGTWNLAFVDNMICKDVVALEDATDDLPSGMRSTLLLSRDPISFETTKTQGI